MLTYHKLMQEIQFFAQHNIETGNIGNSTLGLTIPYIFVGQKDRAKIIIQCAMHAREHITSLLALCMAKHLVSTTQLLDGGIYIVPMLNVDGVRLCQEGVNWIDNEDIRQYIIDVNNGSLDFSLWKANAKGVDLNVNWDADWGKGISNVFHPSSENYVGKNVISEAENKALFHMTQLIKPHCTLSYHCKGQEVYWQYNQSTNLARDKRYAEAIAGHTHYTLIEGTNGSCGGYKDWCISSLGIPAYTIEVGSDEYSHPYPYSQIDNILAENIDLPRRLVNSLSRDIFGS